MKVQLNKWHVKLALIDNYASRRMRFVCGIFKFKSYPAEGCILSAGNYSGFLIEFDLPEIIIFDL
jgi:hypothetical protein